MLGILLTMLFVMLALYAVWTYSLEGAFLKNAKAPSNAMYIIAAAGIAFILRIILSAVYRGHDTDMSCFLGWANAAFEHGLTNFYTLDMFHDYPPGYMYVLYVLGAVLKLFGLSGGASYIVIKLPAVICDIIAGVIIYKIAKRKFSDGIAATLASLYLFNPAAIVNCSLWGQVDSVYTLFALLMIYFITEKKMIYSYFMFAICIFIKPQAFILTPVLIGGIAENVFRDNFTREKFLKNLGMGLLAIVMMLLLALPFGIGNVTEQYKATLASYPHLTVNAFNIWGAMGQNWGELTTVATVLSYVFIAAITVYSIYLIIKCKNDAKYYFAGAMLTFLTYMLATKMHDRYAFPAMVLLLMAFVTTPNLKGYIMYSLVTLSQFFNTAWVLFVYETDTGKYFKSPVIVIASIINIAITVFIVYQSYKLYTQNGIAAVSADKPRAARKPAAAKTAPRQVKKKSIGVSDIMPKITRVDIIAMAVITVVYSCAAIYDLGSMEVPKSGYTLTEPVTIDLGQDYNVSEIDFYLGSYELNENRVLSVAAENSAGESAYSKPIDSGSVFRWNAEEDINASMRYITLYSDNSDEISIEEVAVLDEDGELITPASVNPSDASALIDEQNEYEKEDFRNSTYFDEIYHARTAYEFIHALPVYEWTHPPLGKAIIALGVLIFGMCPFGWRIAGTVFGIFMVPLIYLFAKKLLKKSWLSVVTCILFTFDFMHFAQTRIATIDVYVTFFIMLMYYFMYKYYSASFYDTSFKKGLKMLALSGVSTGLAIASKMTGVYAALGLAVIFFIVMYRRYSEYRYAVSNPKGETDGISHKFIIDNFTPYFIKTIVWCVLFFGVVPITIYCLSYIPFLRAPDQNGLQAIITNQSSMLTYHSKTVLGSTHPFSSKWYEWIVIKRPIWYYSGKLSDTVKEGISSFGNPLVWWAGIPAFFYMIYRLIKNRDKNALFLVIAYLAQLLPWMGVERLTFIYHYFPCVPFLVLMIGYSLMCIYDGVKNKKIAMYSIFGYTAAAVVLFIMFYPVLSGHPVSVDYVNHFLKWFDSWVLI